jgi:hypothetical protein
MPVKEYHIGTVTDNEDPEMNGRLKIECPTIVTGDSIDWVEPVFHFVDSSQQAGAVFIPNIGSQVEVEIESEEDSEVQGLEPKWRCTIYPDGTMPEEFRVDGEYPNIRGWKTAAGHLMLFNDTEDKFEFKYVHPTGSEILVNNDGRIELKPVAGQAVFIGEDADQSMVLGDALEAILSTMTSVFDAHVHDGPIPTTTFPAITGILSSLHKVK